MKYERILIVRDRMVVQFKLAPDEMPRSTEGRKVADRLLAQAYEAIIEERRAIKRGAP